MRNKAEPSESVAASGRQPAIRSEADLVRAAQQGCSASFSELVERYGPRLLRFLRQRTGHLGDAEDLTQETFVRAYRNLQEYRNLASFSTWIFTIASRLAVTHLRRKSIRAAVPIGEIPAQRPEPHTILEQREQSDRLWDLAGQLPKNQQRALELHYAGQLSVRETAQVMGKSQTHVKVLLYRARTALAGKMRHSQAVQRHPGNAGERFIQERVGVS
ncbi:MAG: RNA polymerase sigma factor [Sedimentisphaerales bacterium]|nr:RNA polymerase sigma factor [Sedimentisphaerales bacterium]